MRINKYLSEAGYCSRRSADRLIEAERVFLNGTKAVLGDIVGVSDKVEVDGVRIELGGKKIYIAYHKPVGVITTTDKNSHNNIMEAIARSENKLPDARIYPVGRLDVASSGLIFMTNDNDMTNKLLRPEGRHEKEYRAILESDITDDELDKLRKGVDIGEDRLTLPARVVRKGEKTFLIAIKEGKNRQIRRMCGKIGHIVASLKRTRIMNVKLGYLESGEWRYLEKKEIKQLHDKIGI